MERVGIVVVAGIAMVSLSVLGIMRVIRNPETDRQGLQILNTRLAKGELSADEYQKLYGILTENLQRGISRG